MGMSPSRGSRGHSTMSEINVTPLVDVMLVLLILFMVTAPLIRQGVKMNLPETKSAPIDEAADARLLVSVDASRRIFIGEAEVPLGKFEEKLKANAKAQRDKEVYLQADRTLPYGIVVEIMAAAQRAGISDVGMVTNPIGTNQTLKKKTKEFK